jgi:hypothetical protein
MPHQNPHPGSQAMAGGSPGPLARAYFHVKPFIPRPLRWVLRRVRIPGVWPIDEGAGDVPAEWCGWPGGKRFALVFTHDVESAEGLSRVRDVADLEMEYGFRSSFNLIPEGPYEDPAELREWLGANGFEVGVHDLNHDGHLYDSREAFKRKAASINTYLEKWGAVGFRSGRTESFSSPICIARTNNTATNAASIGRTTFPFIM